MFEWFKKSNYANVVKFPATVPYIDPPAAKPEPITYYSIGPTSNGRLNLSIGYSSITMNKAGVQALINALESAHTNMTTDNEDDEE